MISGLINMVGCELAEHGAGHGYWVGPSGVIRRFDRWDHEGLSVHRRTTPHYMYMTFGLLNMVRPGLAEHEAGRGYCVGLSGVIRRFD